MAQGGKTHYDSDADDEGGDDDDDGDDDDEGGDDNDDDGDDDCGDGGDDNVDDGGGVKAGDDEGGDLQQTLVAICQSFDSDLLNLYI